MSRFKNFEHYMQVFRDRGNDYYNSDDYGRPAKVDLGDFLKAGQKNIQEKIDAGISMRDAIATPDISPWLPQVIQRNVLEAQEPLLVLTPMFTKIAYQAGQVIEFPALGAVSAADIAEMESVPEVRVPESGATTTSKVGKSGIAFRISDETQRYSRFDVMGLHLRACARALARHKEVKSSNFINALGTVCFDNISPTSSLYGVTHGRGLSGAANGSLTLDDLFDTFAQIMLQGFNPDTVIMHPLTFVMFVKDPVLRAITLAGGNQIWFGNWRGNPAKTGPGSRTHVSGGQAVQQGTTVSSDVASGVDDFNQTIDSSPLLPSRWPWPLRIVVSPFIPYDPASKRTNVIVADSNELGYYIEDYPVKIDRWEDMATDVTKVKLVESYCFHIINEGLGIGVMRNVKVVPNEIVLPAQTTIGTSGAVAEIPASVPVP
jgi:hypothetical protein